MTGGYGEVKPPASTPAGKPRGPACEPARPPSRGSRQQPCPLYSPLLLVPPHASKASGYSDGYPFIPSNKHHKRKKDQDLRPSFLPPRARQGSSLRSQPCSLKGPTAKAVAGAINAVECAMHHDHSPTTRWWQKTLPTCGSRPARLLSLRTAQGQACRLWAGIRPSGKLEKRLRCVAITRKRLSHLTANETRKACFQRVIVGL